jgi:hypothetical protein
MGLPFVCLAAHEWEFRRWTPGNVKLLLPPRQSRGVSLVLLAAQGIDPPARPMNFMLSLRRQCQLLGFMRSGV